jgi:hypothetical protein
VDLLADFFALAERAFFPDFLLPAFLPATFFAPELAPELERLRALVLAITPTS